MYSLPLLPAPSLSLDSDSPPSARSLRTEKRDKTDADAMWEWLDEALDNYFYLENEGDDLTRLVLITQQLYRAACLKDYEHITKVLQANARRVKEDPIWGGKKPLQFPPPQKEVLDLPSFLISSSPLPHLPPPLPSPDLLPGPRQARPDRSHSRGWSPRGRGS